MWHKHSYLIFFILLGICACKSTSQARLETADLLAARAGMTEENISVLPFIIRSYQRLNDPNEETVRIYIEGDGYAWQNLTTPSHNPTPVNPIGLKLATHDSGRNVMYFARPCQYNQLYDIKTCKNDYWTSNRFSSEIVDAMDQAIKKALSKTKFKKIELIGFSGGGAIAVLLAAQRNDIYSIRTVAGNLDTKTFTDIHNVSEMTGSKNPVSVALKINTVPQIHFIGAKDYIISEEIFHSYYKASQHSQCVKSFVLKNADHQKSWVINWGKLLKIPVNCGEIH